DPHPMRGILEPPDQRPQQPRAAGKVPAALSSLDPARRKIKMLRSHPAKQPPRTLLHILRWTTRPITRIGNEPLTDTVCLVFRPTHIARKCAADGLGQKF